MASIACGACDCMLWILRPRQETIMVATQQRHLAGGLGIYHPT